MTCRSGSYIRILRQDREPTFATATAVFNQSGSATRVVVTAGHACKAVNLTVDYLSEDFTWRRLGVVSQFRIGEDEDCGVLSVANNECVDTSIAFSSTDIRTMTPHVFTDLARMVGKPAVTLLGFSRAKLGGRISQQMGNYGLLFIPESHQPPGTYGDSGSPLFFEKSDGSLELLGLFVQLHPPASRSMLFMHPTPSLNQMGVVIQ